MTTGGLCVSGLCCPRVVKVCRSCVSVGGTVIWHSKLIEEAFSELRGLMLIETDFRKRPGAAAELFSCSNAPYSASLKTENAGDQPL